MARQLQTGCSNGIAGVVRLDGVQRACGGNAERRGCSDGAAAVNESWIVQPDIVGRHLVLRAERGTRCIGGQGHVLACVSAGDGSGGQASDSEAGRRRRSYHASRNASHVVGVVCTGGKCQFSEMYSFQRVRRTSHTAGSLLTTNPEADTRTSLGLIESD